MNDRERAWLAPARAVGVEYGDVFSCYRDARGTALMERARVNGGTLHTGAKRGRVRDRDALHAAFERLGLALVATYRAGHRSLEGPPMHRLYASSEACVDLDLEDGGANSVFQWFAHDERIAARLTSLHAHFDSDPTPGGFYALRAARSGLELTLVEAKAGRPLVRENYSAEVLAAFERAADDLESATPRGRLVLLDGPTGSGKTWLLRGLIARCPSARYVYCTPDDVGKIAGPSFVHRLVELRDESSEGAFPTVLIVEDGDRCLVPRESGNLSEIQAVLNYSDGLLGAAVDLRMVVSTNAEHLERRPNDSIDAAVLRPGRLSSRIQVLRRTPEEANAILSRLLGRDARMEAPASAARTARRVGFGGESAGVVRGFTLAEIYARASELESASMREDPERPTAAE